MSKVIKILLADDHQLIRESIKAIIQPQKNMKVVHECMNGQEVVDYLKKNANEINLALLDITMPLINGIEVANIISAKYSHINILALTMHAEETYIMKMITAGALGYVLKDAGGEKLLNAINTVYENKKYYSEDVSIKLIDYLLKETPTNSSTLSDREKEILKLITEGLTNKEISSALSISDRTVEAHRRNIIKKLNVKNTPELISFAITNKLV